MKVNDVFINYLVYGKDTKKTIILLHGWGQNIDMMRPIGDALKDEYKILIIDLPGFGKSDVPKTIWSLDDYVYAINEIVEKENIKKPIIMGHSFGGKLAILYSSMYDVTKVVLFAPPINHNQSISFKSRILKALKKFPMMENIGNYMKKYIGSTDYKNASPIMRDILVRHLATDVYSKLKYIKAPTLIIWGENDQAVSPTVAYEIDSQISDSGIVMLPGTHYAYLENLNRVIAILKEFLKER